MSSNKNSCHKKTKGKQKIELKFIECPNRRKVTFSKRKTNIIKKVYELHTLTNSQAMVLLASDSGHIYTYATDKLKPMLTSQSGKRLIETCLNTPEDSTNIDLDSSNALINEIIDKTYATDMDGSFNIIKNHTNNKDNLQTSNMSVLNPVPTVDHINMVSSYDDHYLQYNQHFKKSRLRSNNSNTKRD